MLLKKVFLLLLIFVFTSCQKHHKEQNSLIARVDLMYLYQKNNTLKQVGAIDDVSFVFYKSGFNKVNDSIPVYVEMLKITISENDTAFSLSNSNNAKFSYTFKDSDGAARTEYLKSGKIIGKLIGKELWEIQVSIKDLRFKKYIPTSKSSFTFRETFTTIY